MCLFWHPALVLGHRCDVCAKFPARELADLLDQLELVELEATGAMKAVAKAGLGIDVGLAPALAAGRTLLQVELEAARAI